MKNNSLNFSEANYRVMDISNYSYESTESLKRRIIPYKKLVVPVRMRSVYWKYFGFLANEDGTIITKEKIACTLCKNQMIYNRNTSNLRMHLASRHKNIMSKIDPSAVLESPSPKPKKPTKLGRPNQRSSDGDPDYVYNSGVLGISKKNAEMKDMHVVVSEEGNDSDISNIAIIFPNDVVEYNQAKDLESTVSVGDSSGGGGCISHEITDTIVNFIITDLITPEVVDGKGFQYLMSNMSTKEVEIPNGKRLTQELIPALFSSCKEQLYSAMHVNAISNVSLSFEEWTCADYIKCISIYVHFSQNTDATLHTRLLWTVSYTGTETVGYWSSTLDRLFQEWNINLNYVTAVIVSFTNDQLLAAIKAKNLITVPCFLYTIQQLCNNYCFSHTEIAPILEKCRKLVKYLQDNRIDLRIENTTTTITEDDLVDEDDAAAAADCDLESYNNATTLDRQELWLTTYYMLKSLSLRKNHIEEAVLNLDAGLIPIAPVEEEWKNLADLVALLEPLRTIVISLFEEKNSLISLLKPLVWQVNSTNYELKSEDSPMVCDLKRSIRNSLTATYGDQEVHNLTQIATILDPRFKTFVLQQGKHNIEKTLIELLTNFVNAEGSLSPRHHAGAEDKSSIRRVSNRTSGINSLLGNICAHKPTLSMEDKIRNEVAHYQSENAALLDECPLEWWRHVANKCPNLSRLAYRYNCVPAIVTRTGGNHSLQDYLKFHQKRSTLNVNIADALLFLHSNKNLT